MIFIKTIPNDDGVSAIYNKSHSQLNTSYKGYTTLKYLQALVF